MNPIIRYVINNKKHSVTAIAEDCLHDATDIILNNLESVGIDSWNIDMRNTKMPKTIFATIKADSAEEFETDIERLKLNARNSLMDKYHARRYKTICNFFDDFKHRIQLAATSAQRKDLNILNRHPFKYIDEEAYAEIEKRKHKKNNPLEF